MALTNAERQARYRERLRAAARAGNVDIHRAAVQSFLKAVEAEGPGYSPYEAALEMLPADHDWRSTMAPIVLDLLSLPADPWPGMTYAALVTMIGRRKREASKRGLPTYDKTAMELSLEHKMLAALHRGWLEGTDPQR